jgi:hypothetical protein
MAAANIGTHDARPGSATARELRAEGDETPRLVPGSLHEVREQDRIGQRPDPARDRGDRRGDAARAIEVNVAPSLEPF